MPSSYNTALREMGDEIFRGRHCPCCGQYAKVYYRQINAGMVRSLLRMYKKRGRNWCHIPTELPSRSREEGKLAKWGLCVESTELREDGGRAGWWRVTRKGEAFLQGRERMPKYVIIYNNEVVGFDDNELVSAQDCLRNNFDLNELMSLPWHRI